jgi:putative ABC transport system permease protein
MIRAALKSLLGRKLRLLMSTFAIVLGVAFVAGSLVFSDTLERSFNAIFASSVGDVVVRPEGGTTVEGAPTTRTIPARLVDDLASVPGAARVDGNVTAIGVYVVDKDNKVVGGFGPPAIGANWNDAPAGNGLEGLSIIQGEEPGSPQEVVLDAKTAAKADYVLGDTVRIVTATDRAVLEPQLVGVADFADGGSLNGATLALFDTPTAQDLFLEGKDAYSDLWVTAEPGVTQEELRDAVADRLPEGVEAVTGDEAADEAASALVEAVSFLTTFLLIFAGISLVVGAFLIVNTFSILVAQRSRELALLRALGASKKQVTRSVLIEAFVVGLVGSTLGLGLGVLLAMGIRALFGNFGLDLSGQSLIFQPRTVVAAYAVGVVVTMVAAWLPARRTGRIAPVQALRDDVAMPEASVHRRLVVGVALVVAGAVALGAGLFGGVPRAGWFVGAGVLAILLGVSSAAPVICRPFLALARVVYARGFGSIGNLAGQNSLRNPRRTTATASALMIGLALACTMAIVGDSAKASVDKSVEENFVGDYIVSNVFGQPFSPSIARDMAEVEGVDQVIRERFALAAWEGEDEGLAGVDPGTLDEMELVAASGSFDDLADDTVLVSDEWAEEQDLAVGDTMTWELPAGDTTFEVVGTFEENPIIFFPVLTTVSALEEAGFAKGDNALIIMAGGEQVGLQNRLDEVVADIPVVTVKNEAEFAEEQRGPIDDLVLMIFALLGLALVIAVLGIINTLALSIIERTREVGLLRAIGVSRPQLRWMITLESIVISVLGALLGVVLGIGFGVALMYAIRDEGLEVISVPWDQVGWFLALSVLIGVLAALFPSRRAARLDVLRAIATE